MILTQQHGGNWPVGRRNTETAADKTSVDEGIFSAKPKSATGHQKYCSRSAVSLRVALGGKSAVFLWILQT